MGEITLVRHGQANSAATDEAGYDKLTDLGHKQARWLGEWMHAHDGPFDEVFAGSLRRQQETAAGMGFTNVTTDPRLNEITYYDLSAEMDIFQPAIKRAGPDDFHVHFPATLTAWSEGHLKGSETFDAFCTRVSDVLLMAAQPGKRVLCVTSGGVIARAVAQILDLDIPRMAQIAVPILNTSVHRFHVTPHGTLLATLNSVPHLYHAERIAARTNY